VHQKSINKMDKIKDMQEHTKNMKNC
jgi:hypothetical protein